MSRRWGWGWFAHGGIAVLEETANQHSRDICPWQDKVIQLSTDFGCLAMEVSALRSAVTSLPTRMWLTVTPSQKRAVAPSPADQSVSNLFLFHSIVVRMLVVWEDSQRHHSILSEVYFISVNDMWSFFHQKVELVKTTVYSAVIAFFRFPYFSLLRAENKKIWVMCCLGCNLEDLDFFDLEIQGVPPFVSISRWEDDLTSLHTGRVSPDCSSKFYDKNNVHGPCPPWIQRD
jgi:hypothetical protein